MGNAGFAKIEIRGNVCRTEVHIRNLNMEPGDVAVYLFARNDEGMQGVLLGNIAVSRGSGDVRYTFETKELAQFGMTMEIMEGLFIPLDGETYLASQWKEGILEKGRFHVVEKNAQKEKEEETTEEEISEELWQEQLEEEEKEEKEEKETKEEKAEEQSAEEDRQENREAPNPEERQESADKPIRTTELPLENFMEEADWEKIFRKLRIKCSIIFPFEGKNVECVRMKLDDLKEFPRKYWYLGNNSFLLHGFFNYKHIIFGEAAESGKKEYFIGVPGVFQNPERIMAAMFGFPEFRTVKSLEYKTGNFGYWYRII